MRLSMISSRPILCKAKYLSALCASVRENSNTQLSEGIGRATIESKILAFGKVGGPENLPELKPLDQDPNPIVRAAVQMATAALESAAEQ